MSSKGTVCLMYHEIELPGRELCDGDPGYARYAVSIGNFRAQMQFLKDARTPGINVSQMLVNAGNGVALTFDDGCETDLITAAPILKDLGFQATFYLTVGFLGKRGFMSRQQSRELGDAGFEIGCHSRTHPYLTDLNDGAMEDEVAGAKRDLEDIIGRPVEHFSCPGGRWNAQVVRTAQQAGFKSVATSQIGINGPETASYSLARIAITRDVEMPAFGALCSGSTLWSKGLRSRGLQFAKRVMGNAAYNRVRTVLLKKA